MDTAGVIVISTIAIPTSRQKLGTVNSEARVLIRNGGETERIIGRRDGTEGMRSQVIVGRFRREAVRCKWGEVVIVYSVSRTARWRDCKNE